MREMWARAADPWTLRVLDRVGVTMDIKTGTIPSTEYSAAFLQGMVNRMGVSFHKYGRVADAYPGALDAVKSLEQRLMRYQETGNTEWLMDAANFAMIEFMHPAHPEAHYEPTDSDQSPGRIDAAGRRAYAKHNLDLRDIR